MTQRRLRMFAFLVTACWLLAATPLSAQNTGSSQPTVLSILDFTDNTDDIELAWLSRGLSDMLLTDLAPADITLVDRTDLEEALAEQALALSGITEDESIAVGRMVMADSMLRGAYALSGDILRIDARIIDVETGSVTATAAAYRNKRSVFELEARLAREVCVALGVEPPPGLGEPETTSIPAARAYYEGLALQTSGDVAAAKSRFEEAAQLDPLYAKPRYSLEESWQLLKDFRTLRQQREVNALWRKADSLRRRLAADPFVTDSDAIMAAYTTGTTPQDDPAFGACPTPAVCLWNLQITYWEIGSLSKNYFDDTSTEEATLREIVRLADEGEAAWPEDEWIPEILYWQILAHRWLKNWEEVRTGCERIFVEWPDFRMAWALEDMYETALQKLGG
jgi:TolB-like protein